MRKWVSEWVSEWVSDFGRRSQTIRSQQQSGFRRQFSKLASFPVLCAVEPSSVFAGFSILRLNHHQVFGVVDLTSWHQVFWVVHFTVVSSAVLLGWLGAAWIMLMRRGSSLAIQGKLGRQAFACCIRIAYRHEWHVTDSNRLNHNFRHEPRHDTGYTTWITCDTFQP